MGSERGAPPPSPWSTVNPALQIAWDATSLSALMTCARFYKLRIVDGWAAPAGAHLEYGTLFGDAIAVGDRVLALGGSLEEAASESFKWVLEASGEYFLDPANDERWRPWGGVYAQLWRCTHKPKPGRKRCEFALAGKWHEPPEPGEVCGAMLPEGKGGGVPCGSAIETRWVWVPDNGPKNRETLLRAVVWYWEEQVGSMVRPVVLPGTRRPGVEVHFVLPLGVRASTGEDYLICGYLDNVVEWGVDMFIKERKTTSKALNREYFAQFSPNVQIDHYDLAAQIMFPTLPLQGIMLEAHQTLVGGARFARQFLRRSAAARAEYKRELIDYWLPLAARYAESGNYPMSRSQCRMCDFNGICAKEPISRERWLRAEFERRPWNPLLPAPAPAPASRALAQLEKAAQLNREQAENEA